MLGRRPSPWRMAAIISEIVSAFGSAAMKARRSVPGAVIGDLGRPQIMSTALEGVDAVIHSAGSTRAMSGDPEDDYRALNTEATIRLARAARRAGEFGQTAFGREFGFSIGIGRPRFVRLALDRVGRRSALGADRGEEDEACCPMKPVAAVSAGSMLGLLLQA